MAFSSTDNGNTWNEENFSKIGDVTLNDVACIRNKKNTANSVCVISGHKYLASIHKIIPLLIVSHDAAKTWQVIDQGFPLYGDLKNANCFNKGKQIYCAVAGYFESPQEMGFIVVSADDGKTWNTPVIQNLPINSRFDKLVPKK